MRTMIYSMLAAVGIEYPIANTISKGTLGFECWALDVDVAAVGPTAAGAGRADPRHIIRIFVRCRDGTV